MANLDSTSALAVRSNGGVELWSSSGMKVPYTPDDRFVKDESKSCRAFAFSPDGRFLAWTNGTKVQVCLTKDWSTIVASLARPKTFYIKFSPRGTYLMTWEIFVTTKDNPNGSPNMYIYRTETGEEVYSTIQKRQTDWEPQWSADESIVALMLNGEVQFVEVNSADGFGRVQKRLGGAGRNGTISMAPNNGKPFLAFCVPGTKAVPSMCKIYQYPLPDSNLPSSSKSFYQADKVDLYWNKRGTGLLILTSTEVDVTNNSYYGKQALHFMSTRGDSYSVQLGKEGPIHSVAWSPKSTEFCVIYGFMPAKATVFNLKCDAVHNFADDARNTIHYNTFGNILMLAGFGNLRGTIELYDVSQKEKTLIANIQAPDTTLLEWHPNGEIFVTATTSPRLRMSNGFKVWHYSGALLHETMWPEGQELLEVAWQKMPAGTYTEQPVSSDKVEGIVSSVPQPSTKTYVPPWARGVPNTFASFPGQKQRRLPPGMTLDQPAQRKKKGKQKNTAQEGAATDNASERPESGKKQNKKRNPKPEGGGKPKETGEGNAEIGENGDEEGSKCTNKKSSPLTKEEKIERLKRKIGKVEVLKEKVEAGESLSKSQVRQLHTERSLLAQLGALTIDN